MLARPHLPPLPTSFAEGHDLAYSSQENNWDVGPWYHSSNDAQEAMAMSHVLHTSQPPSLWAMATHPAELQLAPDYFHDVQSDPSLAPGWNIFDARESPSTHFMPSREDLMPSFDSNKPVRLDMTHETFDAPVSEFSDFGHGPLSSWYHDQQIHAGQPQLQHFALPGQSSWSVSAPEYSTVDSPSRYYTGPRDVQTTGERQLESTGLVTWDDAPIWSEQHHPKQFSDHVPLEDVPFHQHGPTSPQDVLRQPHDWLGDFESGTSSTSGHHIPYDENFVQEHHNSPGHRVNSWPTDSLSEGRIREQRMGAAEVQEIPLKITRNNLELSTKEDVEKILNSPSMSTACMSHGFLQRFTSSFEEHIERIFRVRASQLRALETVPGVPVKIYQGKKRNRRLVILNFANEGTRSKTKKINTRYKELMGWLVFANTVALRNLHPTKTYPEELDSHNELSNWLLTQCFNPTDSYPIHGYTDKEVNPQTEENFGYLQRLILRYLELEQNSGRTLRDALKIIRIYYDNSDDFQDKPNNPTTDIERRTAQAIDSNLIVETERLKVESEKLGNLMIPEQDFFPGSMKPEKCRTGYSYKWLDVSRGGGLIQKVDELRSRDFLAPVKRDWSFFQARLNFLILNLNVLQRMVIKHLSHGGISTGLEEHMDEFFQWFENLLFKRGDGQMPIFSWTKSNDSELHRSSKLNSTQRYLVDYIVDPHGTPRTVQVALAFLGCWYKTTAGDIFTSHFKEDLEYWEKMKTIFEDKEGPKDQYDLFLLRM